MEIRPILSTLRRHKTAAALIVLRDRADLRDRLQRAVPDQRAPRAMQPHQRLAENELVRVQLAGIGTDDDAARAHAATSRRCARCPASRTRRVDQPGAVRQQLAGTAASTSTKEQTHPNAQRDRSTSATSSSSTRWA